MNNVEFKYPKLLHRYDEQLRGDDGSDPLLVDLSATLQRPYADLMAAEIMRRWNCHDELIEALERIVAEFFHTHRSPDEMLMAAEQCRNVLAKAKGEV